MSAPTQLAEDIRALELFNEKADKLKGLRGRANRLAAFHTWELPERYKQPSECLLTHTLLAYWRSLLVEIVPGRKGGTL